MITKSNKFLLAAVLALGVVGCAKESEHDKTPVDPNEIRLLVVNEGQFTKGTASLTAITYGGVVTNDVFRAANNDRPIGDLAQSITEIGNYYYVALNNSHKVEVMDKNTFKSVETMFTPADTKPVYCAYLGGDSMAVSELGGTLTIMDINHGIKRDTVRRVLADLGASAQMLVSNGKLFMSGNPLKIMTIGNMTAASMRIIQNKSTDVGSGSRILKDKSGNLWVMNGQEFVCINPATEQVVKTVVCKEIKSWGSFFDMSDNGENIYFVGAANDKNGIYRLNINADAAQIMFQLPALNDIYNMAISPEETVFLCEVKVGTLERGKVHEYALDGKEINMFTAGIFSNDIYFTHKK